MFLNALASALGGVMGHFNPLVAGILLTLGVLLLRPARGRRADRSGHGQVVSRRDPHIAAASLDKDEDEIAVRHRAVAGGGRRSPAISSSTRPTSPSATARRKPPRGGSGFLSLLVVGLSPA